MTVTKVNIIEGDISITLENHSLQVTVYHSSHSFCYNKPEPPQIHARNTSRVQGKVTVLLYHDTP